MSVVVIGGTNKGIPSVVGAGGGGVALLPTTWNPADISSAVLSNGNLTVTASNIGGVRSVGSISSGKYYWEYTMATVNSNNFGVGIAQGNYVLSSASFVGVSIVKRITGQITVNNSTVLANLGTFVGGAIFGLAVDRTANLIWFRNSPAGQWNASGTADPASGTGGFSISALTGAMFGLAATGVGDVCTANFGASAFSGAVPAGFTSGLVA